MAPKQSNWIYFCFDQNDKSFELWLRDDAPGCAAAAPRLQIRTCAHIHTALSGTRAHTNYSQLSYYNQSHASANFIAAAYDSAAGADERRAARTSDGRKKRKTWPEQKHGADDSLKCSRIASMNRQLPFSNSSLGRFFSSFTHISILHAASRAWNWN